MSETKFTKGEWGILPLEDDKEYIRIRGAVVGGRYKIADVRDLKNHHQYGEKWCEVERKESLANAHLIATAPEMYAMLEQFIPMDEDGNGTFIYDEGSEIMGEQVNKLLAKARGEL